MSTVPAAFRAMALFGLIAISACAGVVQPPIASGARSIPSAVKSEDLLYLSDVQTNDVYVFTYPQEKLVGTLSGFGAPRSECVDRTGNVWIVDVQGFDVIEYAHGGGKPIAALSTPWAPHGCSADPRTESIAVSGGKSGTVLAIYHRSAHNVWRDARQYADASIREGYFCGYDARGNLFIDGLGKGGSFRLAELPRRKASLVDVTVDQNIVAPGQVQWDGQYLAIGDSGISPSEVHRFSIGASGATQVGSTALDGTKSVRQFWIDDTRIVGPDFDSSVGIWRYPAGGMALKKITSVHGYGAVVSAAASAPRK